MQALFISRQVTEDSPVRDFVRDHDLPLYDESLIDFQPLEFDLPSDSDWVFFYSRRAVTFFFRGLSAKEQALPAHTRIAVLGDGTAKALKEFGRSPDFSGNGDPQMVAQAFLELAEGRKVLFPHARQSRKSIQTMLEGKVVVQDLIVYTNSIRTDVSIPDCDYLLFTSPLNVEAWQRMHSFRPRQVIVAIGRTTAATISWMGVQALVADEPSEQSMVDCLRKNRTENK